MILALERIDPSLSELHVQGAHEAAAEPLAWDRQTTFWAGDFGSSKRSARELNLAIPGAARSGVRVDEFRRCITIPVMKVRVPRNVEG